MSGFYYADSYTGEFIECPTLDAAKSAVLAGNSRTTHIRIKDQRGFFPAVGFFIGGIYSSIQAPKCFAFRVNVIFQNGYLQTRGDSVCVVFADTVLKALNMLGYGGFTWDGLRSVWVSNSGNYYAAATNADFYDCLTMEELRENPAVRRIIGA